MPSKSEKQRKLMAMAMALHNPSKVRKKNRGVLKMSNKQLHEFASGLNMVGKEHKKKRRKR